MALSFSNLTSSADTALKKKASTQSQNLSSLNLANIGKPPVVGVTNTKVVPSYLQNTGTQTTNKPSTKTTSTAPATSIAQHTQAPSTPVDDGRAALQALLAQKQEELKVAQAREKLEAGAAEANKQKPEKPKETISYGGLVGDLAKTAKEGTTGVQTAIDQLRGFRENAAEYKAGIYKAPTSARIMQGRDAMVQQTNAMREAALQSGVESATASQGQQLTALQGAAGLAQPVQIAPGSTLSSPVDGSTVAGGLGGYANYQTAEQVMSLIRQYPDAKYVYDQTKTPQENLQAFQSGALQNSPTYQKSTYGVPGAQTVAGGTATQAAQQGYTQSVQAYQTMNTAFSNADGQAGLLLEALKGSGINSSDARFANKTINEVRRQLSSSDLQVFDSALKATQAAYGNLLVAGGGTIPTESTNAYNIILNPNASLSAFEASLNQLKREGQVKLNAQGQQVNTYFGQLQAGSPGTQPTGGGGGFAEEWL